MFGHSLGFVFWLFALIGWFISLNWFCNVNGAPSPHARYIPEVWPFLDTTTITMQCFFAARSWVWALGGIFLHLCRLTLELWDAIALMVVLIPYLMMWSYDGSLITDRP